MAAVHFLNDPREARSGAGWRAGLGFALVDRFVAAVVQMTSTPDVERNLEAVERLVRRAAARGATLIEVPENFAFIGDGSPAADETRMRLAEELDAGAKGPIVSRMATLARDTRAFLVLGAMPERAPGETSRAFNTSVVLSPDGAVVARYRKIHLFDVSFENGPTHRESRTIAPGEAKPAIAKLPMASVGLTICYDLRFPELFRRLALAGAELFTVPAAFTLHTGKDHWEPLLRARAIENTTWLAAAAQCGTHVPGRASWGKSMIVDPWGTIVAQASEGEGIAVAEIDPAILERTRRSLPTLAHVVLGRESGWSAKPER